jgi:heme/copper-type cytochrome/quinol oxidase subunit 3
MSASGESVSGVPALQPVGPAGERSPEPPEITARSLSEAARILAGGTAFFFLAFLFAYFYLRSLNEQHAWHPAHVNPNQAFGGAMIGCLVASALVAFLGGRLMKAGNASWVTPMGFAVLLGLAAVALQCLEYTRQHFGPTNGAYASVFCAWTALYMLAVLGAMYWLETHFATELRARRRPAGREGEIAEADRLIAPGLDAAVFYWVFLVALGVIMYVVLYLL